jgi:hypothetical protein
VLALQPEWGAAGYQQAQVGAGGQEISKLRCSSQHLLEVVEQQQDGLIPEGLLHFLKHWMRSTLPQSERLGNGRQYESRVTDGGQRHKADNPSEVGLEITHHLQAQASFANASWAGEGEQAHLAPTQQDGKKGEFALAAKQGGQWQR